MHLNHLDLQVRDVPAAAAFFERHFGLEIRSNRTSTAIAILSDRHGFVLVLQRQKHDTDAYPDGFHLGFYVDDPSDVEAFHARVRSQGVQVSDVIVNGRGTMVYVQAMDGILVEVSCPRART